MLMTIGIIIAVATSLNALLVLGIWSAAAIKEMKRKKRRQSVRRSGIQSAAEARDDEDGQLL